MSLLLLQQNINGELELDCSIKIRVSLGKAFPYTEIRFRDPPDGKPYKAEGHLRSGTQGLQRDTDYTRGNHQARYIGIRNIYALQEEIISP